VKAYHLSAPRTVSPLAECQRIGESFVGAVEWRGAEGFCRCPGEDSHTKHTSATDCKIIVEPVTKQGGTIAPGIYCFHDSCAAAVEAMSFQLRSALGKQCPSPDGWQPRQPLPAPKPKPEFAPDKLARIAAKLDGIDEAWLASRSPIRPDTRTPASFLHALYQDGEKVVVFDDYESQGQHIWTRKPAPFNAGELDSFRKGKAAGVWFLSNPVNGEVLPNDNDKPSRRSWQNVTSWRYLVLESDKADATHWLAVLAQMPLRIASITTSGGKSIHALVRLDAESKAEWDELTNRLKPALVTLGADQKALSAVRLTRLPCCERGGRMQQLLYLNLQPDGAPICERRGI
jgi:hypothetical protein